MATVEHLSVMMQAFASMVQHPQTQNQEMFATVMRVVGTGAQVGTEGNVWGKRLAHDYGVP